MIRRLVIRDLALMDRAELELGAGFTVVTGETGAGKSVLLGALSLLAGHRAAKTVVRKGAEECVVEAEFEVGEDPRFDALLQELDLPVCDEGLLLFKRSVHATKAGRITINGGAATLAQLQQLRDLQLDSMPYASAQTRIPDWPLLTRLVSSGDSQLPFGGLPKQLPPGLCARLREVQVGAVQLPP